MFARDRVDGVAWRRPPIACVRFALVLVLAGAHASFGSAAAPTERSAQWQRVFQQYVQDPAAHRRDLLRLGRRDTAGLQPLYRLALADAHMRSGHLRTAARMFGDIAAEEPGEPWQGFAAAGGGPGVCRSAATANAHGSFFENASAAGGATGVLGDFELVAGSSMPAREDAFARAAADDPSGRLADDALWSRRRVRAVARRRSRRRRLGVARATRHRASGLSRASTPPAASVDERACAAGFDRSGAACRAGRQRWCAEAASACGSGAAEAGCSRWRTGRRRGYIGATGGSCSAGPGTRGR